MEKLGQCNEMCRKIAGNHKINMLKSTLAYFLSTVTLNQGRGEKKFQTECANKNVKTHTEEEEETKCNQRETKNTLIKNLSNQQLKEREINLLAKGLKFIPTLVTNDNQIRQQLLHDFELFARRMRLRYMYYCTEKEQHPFYTKSNQNPPVKQSVALESYLEEVKISLAQINLTKPNHNLLPAEQEALKT